MKIIQVDGRLGRDAEVKTTSGGTKYVRFTLANTSFERGEEKTEWFDVTSYDDYVIDKQIQILKKGSYVIVTGTLRTDVNYENGKLYLNQRVTSLNIDSPNLGKKKDKDEEEEQTVSTYTPTETDEPKAEPSQEPVASAISVEDEDSDLPF